MAAAAAAAVCSVWGHVTRDMGVCLTPLLLYLLIPARHACGTSAGLGADCNSRFSCFVCVFLQVLALPGQQWPSLFSWMVADSACDMSSLWTVVTLRPLTLFLYKGFA
jgi:hypothetical protein